MAGITAGRPIGAATGGKSLRPTTNVFWRRSLGRCMSEASLCAGGLPIINPRSLADDVKRALFYFFVNPPDVFPEDSDGDELHPAEEEDANDFGGEPANLFMPGEEGDEVENRQAEGDEGDKKPQP